MSNDILLDCSNLPAVILNVGEAGVRDRTVVGNIDAADGTENGAGTVVICLTALPHYNVVGSLGGLFALLRMTSDKT